MLKPGDKIVAYGGAGRPVRICTVLRVGKVWAICDASPIDHRAPIGTTWTRIDRAPATEQELADATAYFAQVKEKRAAEAEQQRAYDARREVQIKRRLIGLLDSPTCNDPLDAMPLDAWVAIDEILTRYHV